MSWRAALFALLLGCAGSHAAVPAETTAAPLPSELLSPARAAELRGLAPDFLARAERAEARARNASEPDAAADYAELARLLLSAAEHEAERVKLERQLLAEDLRRDEV
ncbi:MAG TPA: hypothetical protein VJR89_01200, partial [Polyangiales bacterium]|nr:hypothetical protein [Polyangiales bacterium]